ncbi:MAG TPA: GvpL/GvpF family gas vesicle protein, partial [Candidatus Elarobacter sp.]|nr:GvpL/GvpF family gas vesicle protein [Candidatus Elarobacter sp.]
RATAQIGVGDERSVLRWDAYLVEDARYDAFRETLTALVTRYESAGFRFDFTGPWPPFHFVRGD